MREAVSGSLVMMNSSLIVALDVTVDDRTAQTNPRLSESVVEADQCG
jgi:hypothetical protein